MKLDSSNVFTMISTIYGTIVTTIAENQVYQIIIAVLTIIGLVFNILYTAWKWYRKANADGKITPDEVDDLFEEEKKVIDGKDDD